MSLKHTLNIFQYDMTQLQLVKWICQVRIEALFGSKTSYIFKHMSLRGEHFCEQLFRFNRSRKRGHFFGGYLDIPKKRVVQSLSKQGVCVKKSLSYESHVLFLQTRSLYLDLLSYVLFSILGAFRKLGSQDCWFSCWSFLAMAALC